MAVEPRAFSGVVLAGGRSSRMGEDKALIDFKGRPLVQVSLDAIQSAGADEIFVVGGNREALSGIGVRWVPDDYPGEGPLGGIITALRKAETQVVVVLACDHTETAGPAITAVVGALGTADVVVPVVEGRRQTLHAAWRRECLPVVEAAFESGARAVTDALARLEVVDLLDGDPCWFRDADTPADLSRSADGSKQ
ncbi:MAG: molybdenum cofactor guanylyltransferase [Acidimicrobiales bacterium]